MVVCSSSHMKIMYVASLLCAFDRWGNWGSERQSSSPWVTQPGKWYAGESCWNQAPEPILAALVVHKPSAGGASGTVCLPLGPLFYFTCLVELAGRSTADSMLGWNERNFSSQVCCTVNVSHLSFLRWLVRKAVSGGGVERKTGRGFSIQCRSLRWFKKELPQSAFSWKWEQGNITLKKHWSEESLVRLEQAWMVQFTAEECCSSPKWRGPEGRRCLSSHLVSLSSGIKDSGAWRRGSKTADQEGSSGRRSLWWRMPRIEAASGPPRPKLQTEFIYIYISIYLF